jgi:DNA-binding MarR family transcriptional regulator
MSDDNLKSFTSWKLDWVDALMVGVGHREFRIATCLLQHANGSTRLINPSQGRIAKILGSNATSVKRAITKLAKDGVIERVRHNRQRSNIYRFSDTWKGAMMDLKAQREDEWREERARTARYSEGAEVTCQDEPEGAEAPHREGAEATCPDGAEVTPKHLKGTPEVEHLNVEAGSEVEVLSTEASPLRSALPKSAVASNGRVADSNPTSGAIALAETAIVKQFRKAAVDPKASLDRLEAQMAGRH